MLNGLAGRMIARIASKKWIGGPASVVDLGNQTFAVPADILDEMSTRFDSAALAALKSEMRASTITRLRESEGAEFREVLDAEKASDPVSATERFYRVLGFASYNAIDMNSRYGSLVMDLNKELAEAYGFKRTFGLVINNGTSEHLAGQAAFLKNMHDLTAVGGVMLHILPWSGYVNHGFFNYQPILFLDLASANGYEVLELLVGDQRDVLHDLRVRDDLTTHFYPWLEFLAGNRQGNTLIVAVLKKRSGAPFVLPVQGKYLGDMESEELKARYGAQAYDKRPPKGLFAPEDSSHTRSRAYRIKLRIKTGLLNGLRRAARLIVASLWPTL